MSKKQKTNLKPCLERKLLLMSKVQLMLIKTFEWNAKALETQDVQLFNSSLRQKKLNNVL